MNLKNLNSVPGLSLIEVMCALALLSFVIVSLSSLQASLLRNAVKTIERVERIIALNNILHEAHYEEWDENDEKHDKKLEELGLHVSYQRQSIPETSSLSKYEDLFIEKVEVTWSGLFGEQKDQLITFVYKVPEKVSEKKA